MGSVNKAILVGNLGRDAELKFTGNGFAIARFSLATTHRRKDSKTGEWGEDRVAPHRPARQAGRVAARLPEEGQADLRRGPHRDASGTTRTARSGTRPRSCRPRSSCWAAAAAVVVVVAVAPAPRTTTTTVAADSSPSGGTSSGGGGVDPAGGGGEGDDDIPF